MVGIFLDISTHQTQVFFLFSLNFQFDVRFNIPYFMMRCQTKSEENML